MAKFEISPNFQISRRKFLTAASLGASGIMLSGCDAFDSQLSIGSGLRSFLENANGLTYRAQRLLAGRDALARNSPRPISASRSGRTALPPLTTTPTRACSPTISPTGAWKLPASWRSRCR